MRWRLYEQRGSPFTCCFCCHIRTGTFFLGAFSLALRFLSIILTIVVVVNHETDKNHTDVVSFKQGTDIRMEAVATTSSAALNTSSLTSAKNITERGDRYVPELVMNFGAAFFTIGLLYGIIKGRPKFLLPYFCMQVCDFCLSSLIIIGFFTYEPNIKLWVASQRWLPMKDHLTKMNNGWLVLLAGCAAISCLWIKAYCISVVWSCYKYLIQLGATLPVHETAFVIDTDHYVISDTPDGGAAAFNHLRDGGATAADNEILLPPKYEDILHMPPSADVCHGSTSSLPPAYSEVVPEGNGRDSN